MGCFSMILFVLWQQKSASTEDSKTEFSHIRACYCHVCQDVGSLPKFKKCSPSQNISAFETISVTFP